MSFYPDNDQTGELSSSLRLCNSRNNKSLRMERKHRESSSVHRFFSKSLFGITILKLILLFTVDIADGFLNGISLEPSVMGNHMPSSSSYSINRKEYYRNNQITRIKNTNHENFDLIHSKNIHLSYGKHRNRFPLRMTSTSSGSDFKNENDSGSSTRLFASTMKGYRDDIISTPTLLTNSLKSSFNRENEPRFENQNRPKTALKVGVLFLQLGGPERADDVEGFLYNLFADPDIIRLPGIVGILQKPLAYFISKRRAPKSKAAYESIGGGSPIVKYTKAQAAAVQEKLQQLGFNASCYVAMRYWYPFTEQALEEMKADGVNTVVVVPLYPQFSISTSGSSLRVVQDLFFKDLDSWGKIRHTVIPAWYDRPGYVRAMGNLIQKEIDQYTAEEKKEGVHVLFSAHGVPQSYIDIGDPYKDQIEKCVDLIKQEYELEDKSITTHLSYQSRVGPIEWLRPYTDDKLEELGKKGVKNLVVVPVSFVSEHIETLEEIDMEYREVAEENGITNWRRVPALNMDENFISDLASMVTDALHEPAISISEACQLNNCDIDTKPLEVFDKMKKAAVSETISGRIAMVSVAGSFLVELMTGKGLLHFLGMQ